MQFDVVPARQHRLEEYGDVFAGYRAVRLLDDDGRLRGELVWRLATGQTVEITEMGIFDETDRRQGWGSRLLAAGLADMRWFFAGRPYDLRRVYLFCDSVNEAGRAFYESCGFRVEAALPGFYHYCDAVLYVLDAPDRDPPGEQQQTMASPDRTRLIFAFGLLSALRLSSRIADPGGIEPELCSPRSSACSALSSSQVASSCSMRLPGNGAPAPRS